MENYEKIIEEARKQKLDKRFGNTSIEHARILFKEIFLDANNSIKILSDKFNSYFYSKLKNEIKHFLKKDNNNVIEIITTEKNSFLDKLKTLFPKQIKIYLIDYKQFPIDKETKERINFIISDNNSYRYEYSDKDLENGIVKAIANFNSKQDTLILNKIFEELKKAK